MKKKLLALLLACGMVFALAACNNSGEGKAHGQRHEQGKQSFGNGHRDSPINVKKIGGRSRPRNAVKAIVSFSGGKGNQFSSAAISLEKGSISKTISFVLPKETVQEVSPLGRVPFCADRKEPKNRLR